MLTVLGGLAEFERELIRARPDEGRKRAQARGVRFGRTPKLTAHQRAEAIARRAAGQPWSISRGATTSAIPLYRGSTLPRDPCEVLAGLGRRPAFYVVVRCGHRSAPRVIAALARLVHDRQSAADHECNHDNDN